MSQNTFLNCFTYFALHRMGSLMLHRSVNGELPSLSNRISVIFSGEQGDEWLLSETKINAGDLSDSDSFEVSFLS